MYFWIISIAMVLVYAYTIPLALCVNYFSIAEALCGPMMINAFVLVLMGISCLLMRVFIPTSIWNYKQGIFKVDKKQYIFIKNFNISKWKDKVPEMGKTGNFPKDKVYSFETNYLYMFLQETCFAEFLHMFSGVSAFLILPFLSFKSYIYALPMLVVNLILHILPCLIQRFVRFKLAHVYEKKLEKEEKYKGE